MAERIASRLADRLAANRAATGVAIRAPKQAPKKAKAAKVEQPVIVEPAELVVEETDGAEG
jgi:hypothetical protein